MAYTKHQKDFIRGVKSKDSDLRRKKITLTALTDYDDEASAQFFLFCLIS